MSFDNPTTDEIELIEVNRNFLNRIEQFVRAIIKDENSTDVADSVEFAHARRSIEIEMFDEAMSFSIFDE